MLCTVLVRALNTLCLCLLLGTLQGKRLCAQQELVLKGISKGENLYIQNPASVDLADFCVNEIELNGQVIHQHPQVSALEVTLDELPLESEIYIRIRHKNGCKPFVLNQEAIQIPLVFQFIYFIEEAKELRWQTVGQQSDGRFIVQRLIGDEWEALADMPAVGENYRYAPTYEKGYNTFRIQYQRLDKQHYSQTIAAFHKLETITFSPAHVFKGQITFSQNTYYELLNARHEVILKGETKVLPTRRLPPGEYYLVLEGVLHPIVKR